MKIIFETNDLVRLQDDSSLSDYPCYVVKLIKKLDKNNWQAKTWASAWDDELEPDEREIIKVSEKAFDIPLFY